MKGNMMSRDTSTLRIRLRQVNLEYSALVRDRSREGRFVRMSELKAERKALMTLMAMGATGAPLTRQQSVDDLYDSLLPDERGSRPTNLADTVEGYLERSADVLELLS